MTDAFFSFFALVCVFVLKFPLPFIIYERRSGKIDQNLNFVTRRELKTRVENQFLSFFVRR